jgi:hypothetical protein
LCGSESTRRTRSEIDPELRKDADEMLASSAKLGRPLEEPEVNSFVLMELNEFSRELGATGAPGCRPMTHSSSTVTDRDAPELLARSAAVRTVATTSSRSARAETEKTTEVFGKLSP